MADTTDISRLSILEFYLVRERINKANERLRAVAESDSPAAAWNSLTPDEKEQLMADIRYANGIAEVLPKDYPA